MTYVPEPVKRLTRAEQQEQTRVALLDGAIDLFIERGIEATPIEAICEAAGFSRGAFYSNFESKDDLYLEAFRRFLDQLHAAARPPAETAMDGPDSAYAQRLKRLRAVRHDRASVFLAEASLYAIRRPDLTAAVAELHREQLAMAIGFVEQTAETVGVDVSGDAERLANVMQCLTFSTHLFELIDPDLDAEGTLRYATDLLYRGLASQRTKPRRRS